MGGPAQGVSNKADEAHPSADQIGQYFRDDSSLPTTRREELKNHFQTCDRCAYDLHFLQSMETELRGSLRTRPHEVSTLQRMFAFSAKIVRTPAIAYFVIALLVYPSVRWLLAPTDESGNQVGKIYELMTPTRGGGKILTVQRRKDHSTVRLSLEGPIDIENACHSCVVTSEKDLEPVPIQAMFVKEHGQVIIYLDTHEINDGSYVINIRSFPCQSPSAFEEAVYLFSLVTN
jgi:hypothetical protein